jgi:hypothetical protein
MGFLIRVRFLRQNPRLKNVSMASVETDEKLKVSSGHVEGESEEQLLSGKYCDG